MEETPTSVRLFEQASDYLGAVGDGLYPTNQCHNRAQNAWTCFTEEPQCWENSGRFKKSFIIGGENKKTEALCYTIHYDFDSKEHAEFSSNGRNAVSILINISDVLRAVCDGLYPVTQFDYHAHNARICFAGTRQHSWIKGILW